MKDESRFDPFYLKFVIPISFYLFYKCIEQVYFFTLVSQYDVGMRYVCEIAYEMR